MAYRAHAYVASLIPDQGLFVGRFDRDYATGQAAFVAGLATRERIFWHAMWLAPLVVLVIGFVHRRRGE